MIGLLSRLLTNARVPALALVPVALSICPGGIRAADFYAGKQLKIVIGTDYGHKDAAVEIEALNRLATEGSIPSRSARRILEDNPSRLYGIA